MKLVHQDYSFCLDFGQIPIQALVAERPDTFLELIELFMSQVNGEDGKFVLSEGVDIIRIDRYALILTDYLSLDLNPKRVQTELAKRLKLVAMDEDHYVNTMELITAIQTYITSIILDFDATLVIDEQLEVGGIFKLCGVGFDDSSRLVSERIISYMRIMHEFLGIKLFAFVHLLSYLPIEEWGEIVSQLNYEGFSLLLIENNRNDDYNEDMKWSIIDKDLCEIF